MTEPLDSHWLQSLAQKGTQEPLHERLPLSLNAQCIGSVQAAFFGEFMAAQRAVGAAWHACLQFADTGWNIMGDGAAILNQIAQALRMTNAGNVAHLWRDEQLAVCDGAGTRLATVERGAARALGIATHAVHLVGEAPDGRIWIQQRAFDKPTEPGMWDTLMGGMVPASDSLDEALARETWEEAGLVLAELQSVVHGGDFVMRKPDASVHGIGYVVERVNWFRCVVPDPLSPVNRDGEVARFDLVAPAVLREMLYDWQFTTEAALVLSRHQSA